MNLKLDAQSGTGLGSYYSKLKMSALLLCNVKNSYFGTDTYCEEVSNR